MRGDDLRRADAGDMEDLVKNLQKKRASWEATGAVELDLYIGRVGRRCVKTGF